MDFFLRRKWSLDLLISTVLVLPSPLGLKLAPTMSLMNCLRRLFSILTAWDTSTIPSLWICSHRKLAAQKIPLRLAPSLWRQGDLHLLWDQVAGLSLRGVPPDPHTLRIVLATDTTPNQPPQGSLPPLT